MGTEGKGQGMDSRTLGKPIPSSRVRGYPWYMYAMGFSFHIHSFMNKHPLVAEVFIYWLIQCIPLDRIFRSLIGDSQGTGA
jgi:hypothetical protein